MLSVNRYRIRHRAQGGSSAARMLERLLEKTDNWLGANLVILAVASAFASAIATIIAMLTRAGELVWCASPPPTLSLPDPRPSPAT